MKDFTYGRQSMRWCLVKHDVRRCLYLIGKSGEFEVIAVKSRVVDYVVIAVSSRVVDYVVIAVSSRVVDYLVIAVSSRVVDYVVIAVSSRVVDYVVIAVSSRVVDYLVIAVSSRVVDYVVIAVSSRVVDYVVIAVSSRVVDFVVIAVNSRVVDFVVIAVSSRVVDFVVIAVSSRVVDYVVIAVSSRVVDYVVIAVSSRVVDYVVIAVSSRVVDYLVIAVSSRVADYVVIAVSSRVVDYVVIAVKSRVVDYVVIAVTWRKMGDPHFLSVGDQTWVKDSNLHLHYNEITPEVTEWNLVIKNATPEHSGTYECKITDLVQLVRYVDLNVSGDPVVESVTRPPIAVSGKNYVERGQALHLFCNTTGPDGVHLKIDWFKDGDRIDYINYRQVVITNYNLVEKNILVSELLIDRSQASDTGTYICRSTNGHIESIKVTVLLADTNNVKRGYVSREESYSSTTSVRQCLPLVITMTLFTWAGIIS
ncbi:hypothetical protein Btru_037157 [Bulinus truncatus]|nr:hypothetical protein Btru_037157 [Bulinus truncatus]